MCNNVFHTSCSNKSCLCANLCENNFIWFEEVLQQLFRSFHEKKKSIDSSNVAQKHQNNLPRSHHWGCWEQRCSRWPPGRGRSSLRGAGSCPGSTDAGLHTWSRSRTPDCRGWRSRPPLLCHSPLRSFTKTKRQQLHQHAQYTLIPLFKFNKH